MELPDKLYLVIICVTLITIALVVKEQYDFAIAGLTALAGLLVPSKVGLNESGA